ncbi:hypothetical protein [Streptomyces sp. NPDC014623]|uniref:hypothetical protein n=1 Tax=Streptomyces sp. NPDC014623 TaxID=3364875 RepID=UPI0036FE4B26
MAETIVSTTGVRTVACARRTGGHGSGAAGRTGRRVVTLGAAVAAGFGDGGLHGVLLSLGALVGEAAFSLLALPLLPGLGP